ncbi:MAG TPA: type I restriction enzyme endonuclease domain-containing protein, partial [Chloroflexota bacterium]|nr:type I restriction enzyme endonuclease domain-containing protein [Chloroflexota bacterium]
RMLAEELDEKFKDAADPLRIVFVCAMWMTGFDVPSLSTIYLDKPLRNHTLMQTIARANRVVEGKNNGLIVDYVGVFRSLQRALAIYAMGPTAEPPLQDKEQLIEALRQTIAETTAFCHDHGVDPSAIVKAKGFERIRLLEQAREGILASEDEKRRYVWLAGRVSTLYKAILPDEQANEFAAIRTLFSILAEMIRSMTTAADISQVMATIDGLLDRSVAAQAYVIADEKGTYELDRRIDLSRIDFAAIRKRFDEGFKRTEIERLKALLERKLTEMVALNHERADLAEKLQRLIDEYNAGSLNVELFFDRLVAFTSELDAEEKRGIAENLSEEELALFDLLTKPDIGLTEKERDQVKTAARELLASLKREKFVLDWRKRQQTRAGVILAIEQLLDRELPRRFTPELYKQKCDAVYQHVYDSYFGAGTSIYAAVGLAS